MTTRVLMCAPRFITPLDEGATWAGGALDPEQAMQEWVGLRDLVQRHVGTVEELDAEPWAPAMTFTRDLALVDGGVTVPLMPVNNRGPFEAPLVHRHLASMGCNVVATEEPLRFDGGNVLADNHGRLLIGVTTPRPCDDFMTAVRTLESSTGRGAYRVPIAGGRFPHIDMAVADLNGKAWLVYPDALVGFDPSDAAWRDLFVGLPVVIAGPADGELLGCNLVIAGDVAIGPDISRGLRAQLADQGIEYIGTPLNELRKAGGGAHCLTLELPRRS